ncbi:hydroxyproline dehydrogenase-like isoform X2 [Mizuhopecten yessoensis]|uniref:Proline dehydrogenase n=1 Tax=Mizuhopecten yessoensis TaxID=6573 RepID=A0A210R6J0_MIZYE|nr:hydroxyproline dehydrogenase-like isoform X2 [Mizuhopecten yessoensis]OWF56650.1 proline dehydrogenase 2 [Mizuhopecten yessoensis]
MATISSRVFRGPLHKTCVKKLFRTHHSSEKFGTQFSAAASISEKGECTNVTDDIRFDDYRKAFRSMSRLELARSIAILRLCANNRVVDSSLQLMNTSRKVLGRRLFDKIAKGTVYGQFVGGDSPESLRTTVARLHDTGIGPLVAVSMEEDTTDDVIEADRKYNRNLNAVLECLHVISGLNDPHPMMQVKVTSLLPAKLCEAISKHVPHPSQTGHVVEKVANAMLHDDKITMDFLSEEQMAELHRGLSRLKKICEAAVDKGVIVMVDAEYTYFNPALNLLSLAMMLVCNRQKTLVYYTYQNYLQGMDDYMKTDMTYIHSHGVGFGTKLVRGAYIDKERRLAREAGYPDPTNPCHQATSDTYHRSMNVMLDSIAKNPERSSAIIASHNETTVSKAVKRIKDLQINPKGGSVFFGQLFGMCEHVTFTLSEMKMPVYKSIPYGSVEDTLAYLSRRAMENRSVLERAQREKTLMWKALKER